MSLAMTLMASWDDAIGDGRRAELTFCNIIFDSSRRKKPRPSDIEEGLAVVAVQSRETKG
jgi:hypothetical protein